MFIHLTGALQAPTGSLPAAALAVQHHQVLVIAMLLAGVPSLVSGFAINDPTAKGQAISLALVPVFVIAALAIGLSIGGHRDWALASFPVLLTIGGLLRKFGPRGFTSGVLFFIGDFIGFFLHGVFHIGDLGWLAAEVGVATVVLAVVRFTLFFPNADKARARTQRSYVARAHRVAELAVEVMERPGPRAKRRLDRQLIRLNEAALIIDAQLPPTNVAQHQRLFDIELSLSNLARYAEALSERDLPDGAHRAIRRALAAVGRGDRAVTRAAAADLSAALDGAVLPDPLPEDQRATVVIAYRFASSAAHLFDAVDPFLGGSGLGESGPDASGGPADPDERFDPATNLAGGWLPGSANVSASASTLPLNVRVGLQMGVSVGAAVLAGDALSPKRFYWAVLAAFMAFIGTNFAMEQVRKAIYRVIGTIFGIALGALLVRWIGHDAGGSIAVILVAIFIGVYLFRVSYAFMVIGITVAISQVYVQLEEYSFHLLLVRLAETAIGAGCALVTILVVLPLRSRKVVGVALAGELTALGSLVEATVADLGSAADGTVRTAEAHHAAREVDAAFQALLAAGQPLRWSSFGDFSEQVSRTLVIAQGARNFARNLVTDADRAGPVDAELLAQISRGAGHLGESLCVIQAACAGDTSGTYVRSAAIFEWVDRHLTTGLANPLRLVLRDLKLLDASLARMADVWGVDVTSLDVGQHPSPPPARAEPEATPSAPVPVAVMPVSTPEPPPPAPPPEPDPLPNVEERDTWELEIRLTFRWSRPRRR